MTGHRSLAPKSRTLSMTTMAPSSLQRMHCPNSSGCSNIKYVLRKKAGSVSGMPFTATERWRDFFAREDRRGPVSELSHALSGVAAMCQAQSTSPAALPLIAPRHAVQAARWLAEGSRVKERSALTQSSIQKARCGGAVVRCDAVRVLVLRGSEGCAGGVADVGGEREPAAARTWGSPQPSKQATAYRVLLCCTGRSCSSFGFISAQLALVQVGCTCPVVSVLAGECTPLLSLVRHCAS